MGVKKFIKKSVAFVAAAAMALTMVVAPVGAGASTSYAEETKDNLHLSKGIELQSDGNYKITLEAYSTGTDTTTTTEKVVPLDIVLVLDQSGSMAHGFGNPIDKDSEENKELGQTEGYFVYKSSDNNYYEARFRNNNWQYNNGYYWKGINNNSIYISRLTALKYSVTNFVNLVEQNAEANNVDHRIAMVGFASGSQNGDGSQSNYLNTELFIGSNQYNYAGSSGKGSNQGAATASSQYKNAFQSVKTNKSNLTDSIEALDASGATHPQYGLEMANGIFEQNSNIITNSNGTTTERKRVVVMFTDGSPGNQGFTESVANKAITNAKNLKDTYKASVYSIGIFDGADPNGTSNENKFMNYVSSNYPEATAMNATGNKIEKPIYYKTASNAGELSDVFESIQQSETTSGTTVTLTSDSVLRDIISDKFELPEGAEANSVKVYTADSNKVNEDGSITWNTRVEDTSNKYTVSIDGNKVDVTGFNYSDKFVTASHSGQKLIVEILVNGLQSGIGMDSNDTEQAKSGIYENSSATTAVKNFESPTVTIPEYSYVLDYGKKVTIPNTDESQSKAYSETTQINSTKAAPTKLTSIKKTYGKFAFDSNKQLTYQPEKINWDGFDSIFSFGKKTDGKYEWSKTNVIPATSVYYEDDFGTDSNTDANVAIVWSEGWSTDNDKAGINSKDNQQSSANKDYGWDDSYADDVNYSNGSAHYSSTRLASAKFRFTGTAVDVYSRTNKNVGQILASIKKVGKDSTGKETLTSIKTKTMDNLSESGDYYQIPTLTFDNLEYGTYEVTIKVLPLTDGSRGIYYLDGIRVYNPLKDNQTANEAYDKANEANAQYITVRSGLLDTTNTTSIPSEMAGSVFIDKIPNSEEHTTTNIGTYKDYGPKNEVYLQNGQGVAFTIKNYSTTDKVYIGLKSPTGADITVDVTAGAKKSNPLKVRSASDLYYEVTPTSDGKVVIKNTSGGLLSVTKVKITSKNVETNQNAKKSLVVDPSLMSYVDTFDTLPVQEDTTNNNQGSTTEDSQDTTLDKDDVEIDNPSDNKDNNQDKNNEQTKPNNIWEQIMNSIKGWFRR